MDVWIDISEYAIENSLEEVKNYLQVGNAKLEFDDNYFDLVISINTIHNLDLDDCLTSIKKFHVFRKLIIYNSRRYNTMKKK